MQSEIAGIPAEILARLVEATELSDAAVIEQVIEDIRIRNSALADSLADLAENFAYDKILDIVQIGKRI